MELIAQLRRSSASFAQLLDIIENNAGAINSYDVYVTSNIGISANDSATKSVAKTVDLSAKLASEGVTESDIINVTNILANVGTSTDQKWMDASTFFNWETTGSNSNKQLKIYQNNLLDRSCFDSSLLTGTGEPVQLIIYVKIIKGVG